MSSSRVSKCVAVAVAVAVVGATVGIGLAIPSLGAAEVGPVVPESFDFSEEHVPPVEAPIVDPFRAPEHAFGPGNRGIEYGTTPGQVVAASAEGTIKFAGQVGGNLFVTVDHGGGLVTTVGFLDSITVGVGENVSRGQRLGTAGTSTHFSARQDGVHFNPELLFAAFEIVVRLVPGPG